MKNSFSKQFWNLLGVKHQVYDIRDIFKKIRDKQADERQFNKFKNDNESIGIEAWFVNQHLETNNFFLLCNGLFSKKDEKFYFYRSQLLNIVHNYKIFTQLQFSTNYFVNLLAFQVALILEYMNYYKISTDIFDKALEKKNIWSFIELLNNQHQELKTKDIIAQTVINYNEMCNKIHRKKDKEFLKDSTVKRSAILYI